MDDDDVDKQRARDEAADDEQISRFCDAFVSDFDGTSALILSALEKDTDSPMVLVETLTEILRDSETCLPAATCDRFESELIPQVVQTVLRKSEQAAMDMESVECLADFLESVLERVAHRLLYCDPCLLPTLLRILDEQRVFYENRLDNTAGESLPFVTANVGGSRVSTLYLRIVSHWGAVDGFTIFLRCLQASGPRTVSIDGDENEGKDCSPTANESVSQPNDDTHSDVSVFPFDAIQCIYRSIYAVKGHLSHDLLRQYVGPLAQSSRMYVASMTEHELTSIPREKLLEIVHIVELVVAQVATARDANEDEQEAIAIEEAELCVQLLQLDLMLHFFTSCSLEKRIYGLVEMIDMLNKVSTANQLGVYCKWIHDNQVASLLFGEKKHPELIKRALPLVRFVLTSDESARDDWLDALWVCFAGKSCNTTRTPSTSSHEIVRVTVHALLLEVIGFAKHDLLEQLMARIEASSRPVDGDVLALVSSVAKQTSAVREPALLYLWTKLPTAVSSAISDQAIDDMVAALCLGLDDSDIQPVDEYLRLCIESINSETSHLSVALRLVEKIASVVNTRQVRVASSIAATVVPAILTEMSLFEQRFKHTGDDDHSSSATVSDLHVHGVRERLLALRGGMVIAHASPSPVSALKVVNTAWDLCVSRTYHNDDSASLFFQWIEYCFRTKIRSEAVGSESESHRLLDEGLAEKLFHQRFALLEGQSMTMSALACFHHLFRQVNIAHGGVVVHDGEGAEVDEEFETDDTDAAIRFSDLLTGKPLVGVEELWRFALCAADQAVAEEAMTLLARYHMDVVPKLVDSEFAYERKRVFVAKCTSHLLAGRADSDGAIARGDETIIGRCLDCLRYFLEANHAGIQSLGGGSQQTKGHNAMAGDEDGLNKFALENLEEKLQLLDVYPSPMKNAPYASSGASSSETASAPVILYKGPRRPSWNFRQHHALLESIQDEGDTDARQSDQETMSEDKGAGEHSLEKPIAERRLSIDTSMPAPPVRPTQVTTSPSVRARPNLQWFQASHGLSLQEPKFVLNGLEEVDATTAAEFDTSYMKSPVSVAHLLVNWPKLFDSLFELVEWNNAAMSHRAWGLLCQLPINTDVLKRMLKLRSASNADVSWSLLLDANSPHRLLYALRLIEALLLPRQQKKEPANQSEDKVRRQWRERFLRLGGAQHINHLLSILRPSSDNRNNETPIVLSCIGALARILTYVTRLHNAPSDRIDPTSPFDSRLCHTTLPQAFPPCGDQFESLFTLVVEIMAPKTPRRKDARSEATALCIIELFCSLVPLNPTLTVDDRIRTGVRDLLEVAFSTFESKDSRHKVIQLVVNMEQHFASRVVSHGFYEIVLKAAFEMSGNGDQGDDDLLELLVALSPHLSTLSQWMVESSIVSDILTKVDSLVRTVSSSKPSLPLTSNLRLIAAMVSQKGKLQDVCVNFQPAGEIELSELPWLLDLVVRRILWTTSENALTVDDPATRRAAQDIVMALVFTSGSRSDTYKSIVLGHLSSYYQSLQSRLATMGRPWNLQPSDELQDTGPNGIRFAGLVNPGCVCYMNSLMQQLFMMPAFRNGLLMLDASSSCNEWQSEITALQKLFVRLAASERKALDPTEFALSHRDMDGNPTDLNLQMDADEFFCLLLDRVETCVLGSSPIKDDPSARSTFLDRCFGGVLVNQILTEHGHLSEREEKFFALSLDISQKQQLHESLSLYVQGETLDGDNAYYCENANKKVSATKRVCIKTLPQTLVCHLKRFEFDFDTMQKIKIHDYLAFPEEIDMYPYTSQAFAATPADADSLSAPIMYDLVGIVVHSGSSDMGHYYSFIKDRAATAQDASHWFEFNDQSVKPFDVVTMGDECFGGEEVTQKWDHGSRAYVPMVQRKRRSAYMLVYERREAPGETKDPNRLSSATIDWKTTPLSVQKQHELVMRENQEMRHIVNAVAQEHIDFLRRVVDASVANTIENPVCPSVGELGREDRTAADLEQDILQMKEADVHTAVISCQHIFGLSSLLQSDDDATIGTLLGRIEEWLKEQVVTSIDRKLLFCEWLLGQVTATATSVTAQSERVFLRRSWLLDVLLFCDKRQEFVQSCCSLFLHSLQFIVAHGRTIQDRRAAIEFLRYCGEFFYERHDIVIEDVVTGSGFPVPQASIVHAVTLLGSFMKDCLTSGDEENRMKELVLTKSGFIDRFLFSLQDNESSRRPEACTMAPLTSRERSCTFSLERQLLMDAFVALPMLQDNILKDPRLLLNHSVLKNIVAYDFTEVLTPMIEYTARGHFTRGQGEKFVSLLLAVLEELKSTHLDQVLHVFAALLDAAAQVDYSNWLTSIHEHIFSPSTGLLEAAAYYRDHRTLHEYAFLLVEFVVTRAGTSPRLQRYFQNDEDIAGQVEWIKHWLGSYLDPHGTIRRTCSETLDQDTEEAQGEMNDQREDPTLETEVRSIFQKAERAFGFAMLQTHTSSHDDDDGDDDVEDKLFAVESLEDSDGLLFSSDGENQDDEGDAVLEQSTIVKAATAKRVVHLARRPSLDTNVTLGDPTKSERNRPGVDEEASSSSMIVTRAHMSSAA